MSRIDRVPDPISTDPRLAGTHDVFRNPLWCERAPFAVVRRSGFAVEAVGDTPDRPGLELVVDAVR